MYKDDLARKESLSNAFLALREYMQGRARENEVRNALTQHEDRFGFGIAKARHSFREALKIDDEYARHNLCYEAIELITRYLIAKRV